MLLMLCLWLSWPALLMLLVRTITTGVSVCGCWNKLTCQHWDPLVESSVSLLMLLLLKIVNWQVLIPLRMHMIEERSSVHNINICKCGKKISERNYITDPYKQCCWTHAQASDIFISPFRFTHFWSLLHLSNL